MVNDIKFRVGTNDRSLFEASTIHDFYGIADLDLSNYVVISVGSHVGGFTCAAIKQGARHIICIEPFSRNNDIARQAISLHCEIGGKFHVDFQQKALWHKNEDLYLSAPRHTAVTGIDTGSYTVQRTGSPDTKVEALTIEELIVIIASAKRSGMRVFCKSDANGAEFAILSNKGLIEMFDIFTGIAYTNSPAAECITLDTMSERPSLNMIESILDAFFGGVVVQDFGDGRGYFRASRATDTNLNQSKLVFRRRKRSRRKH